MQERSSATARFEQNECRLGKGDLEGYSRKARAGTDIEDTGVLSRDDRRSQCQAWHQMTRRQARPVPRSDQVHPVRPPEKEPGVCCQRTDPPLPHRETHLRAQGLEPRIKTGEVVLQLRCAVTPRIEVVVWMFHVERFRLCGPGPPAVRRWRGIVPRGTSTTFSSCTVIYRCRTLKRSYQAPGPRSPRPGWSRLPAGHPGAPR